MKLSKKELLYLKHATTDSAQAGIFNFENYDERPFKENYGLAMDEIGGLAVSIRQKLNIELNKQDMKLIAKNINKKLNEIT